MLEIALMQYGITEHLFKRITHSRPIVFGILEGNNPGRVFVDNAESATSALVCAGGNYFYLAGQSKNREFIVQTAELITNIQNAGADKSAVVFAFDEEWRQALDETLAPYGAFRIGRRVFTFDAARHKHTAATITSIPPGLVLRKMDSSAGEIIGAAETWGSAGQYLAKGFGWCMYCNNELIGGCHTVFVGREWAELSVFTDERFSRRGIASITATATIAECLSRSLIPSWSCWDYNEPSAALAAKLGFVEQPMVQAHYWEYRQ